MRWIADKWLNTDERMFYPESILFSGKDVEDRLYADSGWGWSKDQWQGERRQLNQSLVNKYFVLIDQERQAV